MSEQIDSLGLRTDSVISDDTFYRNSDDSIRPKHVSRWIGYVTLKYGLYSSTPFQLVPAKLLYASGGEVPLLAQERALPN